MELRNEKIEKIIKRNKAFWKYNNSNLHVQTAKSKLHSDQYLNTDYIVADVELVELIVREVFVKELNSKQLKPDWIISYPPFGLPIAYALARQIGAKFGYVDTKTELCDFEIKSNDTVVVIGDDIYSAGSIKKTINIVNKLGKVVPPILTIGNFSGAKLILDLEVVSAITEKGSLYEAENCPMCKSGSKAVLPRPNWKELLESNQLKRKL